MSLPITKTFSPVPEVNSFEEVRDYLQKLKVELEEAYQTSTQNINGFYRNNADTDGSQYVPTITTTGVTGTIDYVNQNGYVLRQGLLTFVWFRLNWTTIGTSTGNIRLNLPYKVTKPTTSLAGFNNFVGYASTGGATTSWSGRTQLGCIALADTSLLRLFTTGEGQTATDMAITANMFMNGSIIYVGVEDE